ncbi:hypothetical protein LTS18_000910, partial [Coniosporium uncinatum]
MASAPLPQPRNYDQQVDFSYNRFLFRPGELVWFDRGGAWGLGMLTRRYNTKDLGGNDVTKAYIVQPLSYPNDSRNTAVHISDESQLRPWLAWSLPALTNAALNNMNVTFDTADWQGILGHKYGQGDAGVDGSILAARGIDASHSLSEHLKSGSQGSVEERRWNCIFLGGEKIWIGDPVRLRVGSGTEILVVIEIVERRITRQGYSQPHTNICVVGDVYTAAPCPPNQIPPEDKNVPSRMREDMRIRNSITIPTKRYAGHWRLLQTMATRDIGDITGRWYEFSLLLPILEGEQYHQRFQTGDVKEAGVSLNS